MNNTKTRKKPPGVLAPEEEAVRDSPKAFPPTNLLPVPDCHHTAGPTAGQSTSSVLSLLLFHLKANERRTISRAKSEREQAWMSLKETILLVRGSTI